MHQLFRGSLITISVMLSAAKHLDFTATSKEEILRLAPQDDL
jgi:hypothetical protein